MEGLESEHQTPDRNDMEEALGFLCGDDTGKPASNVHNTEGGLQSAKGNGTEAASNAFYSENGYQQSPKRNYTDKVASITPHVECNSDGTPTLGMKFFSEHEAYDFYNAYAARIGFSIRKGGIRHNTKGNIRQRNFVCSKEGLKLDCDGVQRGHKLDTRTDCKASIRLTVTDGVWEVTRFNPDHNHELAEPEQRKFLRSTRRFFEASPITSTVTAETVCHAQEEVVRIPSVGTKVYSEDEAYNLYNIYATKIGFSIRKGGNRHNSRGELRHRNYVCSKQGLRLDDEPDRVRKVNRLETRTNCKARIRFTITGGVWEVCYLNPDHNHKLAGPEERKFLRSSRKILQANAGLDVSVNNDNYGQMKAKSPLTEEVGGINYVGFPRHDSQNLLHTQRTKITEAGDVQNVIDYFKRKQSEDSMFFYSVKVDNNNCLTNFFWRDGRSRIDFDCFGDVIFFGTSFRPGEHGLIFGPFLGVNHHGKDVLFGCGILSDETSPSFTWLLETFLESMGNQQPKTIFTNRCQRMANAIEKVFPSTRHRLDVWHIKECALQLSNLYTNPKFKAKFNECLYECCTETEFQSNWDELFGEFNLAENGWLKVLYDIRGKWCSAFSANTFSANMRFIERSNGNRSPFERMSCMTMNLTQFVHTYGDIVERLRLTELEDDVRCNQSAPTRVSRNSTMLKQAADVYTTEIFKLFQEEMVESLSIVMYERSNNGVSHTYELTDESDEGGHIVHFNSENCATACSCKMFESTGLLCRHALRVLNMRNVTKVPAQYILKRWTKSARKGASFPAQDDEPSNHKVKSSRSLLRSRLMYKAFCAVEKSLMTAKGSEIADALLDQIIEQVERHVTSMDVDIDNGESVSVNDESVNDTNDTQCLLESTPMINNSHAKQQPESQKKRRRKTSKPFVRPGQEKQQVIVSPTVLFPPQQIPTFFRPAFHPSMIAMDASSYTMSAFHQGHFPTWVLSNFRPPSPLAKSDQMPHNSRVSTLVSTCSVQESNNQIME